MGEGEKEDCPSSLFFVRISSPSVDKIKGMEKERGMKGANGIKGEGDRK